jgi:hypothetical protein
MSKQKNKQGSSSKRLVSDSPDSVTDETSAGNDSNEASSSFAWSKFGRQVASAIIVLYLVVVVIGPLSNPIGSLHFSVPIAEKISPIQRVLFLGHGYRFFAPDPGPTHRLLYRGARADGTKFSGHFPDRDNNWPRLLYHRWFMLSETLFNEQALKPSATQFKQRQKEYDRQILRLRTEGKRELLDQLIRERELETTFFETSTARIELLASAVAKVLLQRNEGESIELFVQERRIPYPEEVADGLQLDAESLLVDPVKIGEMDADGFRISEPVETLPAMEESK